jgi:hypothetical protein
MESKITTPPGWYVIEEPHQDPAKVVHGPCAPEEAKDAARFGALQRNIMHTPALVNAIQNEGYNVRWFDTVEKPEVLADNAE